MVKENPDLPQIKERCTWHEEIQHPLTTSNVGLGDSIQESPQGDLTVPQTDLQKFVT